MIFSIGILGISTNILQNTGVQEKLLEFRAEEFATSIGLLSSFDNENFVEMEKRFGRVYELQFNDSGSKENLTMSPNSTLSDQVEVQIPSEEPLPEKVIVNDTVCLNSSSGSGGVEIYEGDC